MAGIVKPLLAAVAAVMCGIAVAESAAPDSATGQVTGYCRYEVTDFGGEFLADFHESDTVKVKCDQSIHGKVGALILRVDAPMAASGAEFELTVASWLPHFSQTVGILDAEPGADGRIVQEFTLPPPPDNGWRHVAGHGEPKVRETLRTVSLTVRKGSADAGSFDMRCRLFADVTPDKDFIAMSAMRKEGAAGTPTPEVALNVLNISEESAEARVAVRGSDWDGNVFAETLAEPIVLAPLAWTRTDVTLPPPTPGRNFASWEFALLIDGQTPDTVPPTRKCEVTWTAPVAAVPDAALRPESPWGMGVYLYRNNANAEGYARMERVAEAAQRIGVKWSREEFSWHRIEPRKGEFDFSFYDKVVETAIRHGISVYGLFDYWSTWAEEYTEEGYRDYCTALRETVRHFKGKVRHWEIWNEPNVSFWTGPKDDYPKLLSMAYAVVKEEDPDAVVLGCSVARIDKDFIRMCLDANAPMDALTLHPYRGDVVEERLAAELEETSELIGGRPIWITEMGWPTWRNGKSERDVAQLLARAYMTAIGTGRVANMGWYNFVDDGENPFFSEANFGILRRDMTPKPAYRAAAKVFCTFDRGAPEFDPGISGGPGRPAVRVFRMGGRTAVWADSAEPVEVRVSVKEPASVRITNLMDEPVQSERDSGGITFRTDRFHPVFIDGDASAAALAAAAAVSGASAQDAPSEPLMRFGVISDTHVRLAPGGKFLAKNYGTEILEKAFGWFRDNDADAVVLAGDITDSGLRGELEAVAETWFKVFPGDKAPDGRKVERIFVTGNHDALNYSATKKIFPDPETLERESIAKDPRNAWRECFHEEYERFFIKTVKGYDFFCVQWAPGTQSNGHAETACAGFEEAFRARMSELDPGKPFFFVQHTHPRDTVYGANAWGRDDGSATRFLSDYPQAIAFSGHSHEPLTNEKAIWRGAFTSVATGSLRYLSVDVHSICRSDIRVGMLVSVYADHIEFEKREFESGVAIGKPWVVPVPFVPASFEERANVSPPPEFPEDASLEITVMEDAIQLDFPAATLGGHVTEYEISASGQDGTLFATRVCAIGGLYPEEHPKFWQPESAVVALDRLPAGAAKVRVTPLDSFGNPGRPLEAPLTTVWQF